MFLKLKAMRKRTRRIAIPKQGGRGARPQVAVPSQRVEQKHLIDEQSEHVFETKSH